MLHWVIVSLPILQPHNLHKLYHHVSLICLILFICSALCLQSLTNPVICIHMLFGFMWCQKEMVLAWSKELFDMLKFNSGWQPTKHRPTWLFRCSRAEHTHLIIYCCFFFFLSVSFRGSVLRSARESEGGERIFNQAAEGMHCQEVCVNL